MARRLPLRSLNGGQVQFTASFGVTDSQAATSLQELIQLADVGLYLSKSSGRDCTSVGVPSEVRQALGGANGTRRAPAMHQVAADDEPHTA